MSFDHLELASFNTQGGSSAPSHDEAIASGQIGELLPINLEPGTVLAELTDGTRIELLCERHPDWQKHRVELLSGLAEDSRRKSEVDALQWATLDGSSLVHRDGTHAHVERKGSLTSICLIYGCVLLRDGKAIGFSTMACLLEFGERQGADLIVSLDEVWVAPAWRGRGYAEPLANAGAAVARQFLRAVGEVFKDAIRAGELSAMDMLAVTPVLEVDVKSESGDRFAGQLERVLDKKLPRVMPGLTLGGFRFQYAN